MNSFASQTAIRAFKIEASDNVATLLEDTEGGVVIVHGAGVLLQVNAVEPIALGHKIALAEVKEGHAIMKYGVVIGLATVPIVAGAWVHLHNCCSQLDERSNRLDPRTGAAMDTPYA
jgi:altronate dehydratase small subunit